MPLDLYGTAVQLEAMKFMPTPESHLYDMLVEELAPLEDETAIWDTMRGDRRMAPFIHDGAEPVLIGNKGYKTEQIIFPTIGISKKVSDAEVRKRAFGEAIMGSMTPDERAQERNMADNKELSDSIQNTREMMTAQLLDTGRVEIYEYTSEGLSNEVTKVADFEFENELTLSKPWTDADADIPGNINAMCQLNAKGMGTAEILLVGADAGTALRKNAGFMKELDVRNIDYASMTLKRTNIPGVNFIGRTADGLEIVQDLRTYVDFQGVTRNFLNPKKAYMVSRKMFRGYHAPVLLVDEDGANGKYVYYMQREVPVRMASTKNNTIRQIMYSRPMILPKNIMGWSTATVV